MTWIAKLLVLILILVSCADSQNISSDAALLEAAKGSVWNQPKTTLTWNIIDPSLFLLNFEDAQSKCSSLTETNTDWRLPSFSEASEAAAAKIVEAYRSESTWQPKLFWTSSLALSLEADNYKTIRLVDSASEPKPAEALAYTICVRGTEAQEKSGIDQKTTDSTDKNGQKSKSSESTNESSKTDNQATTSTSESAQTGAASETTSDTSKSTNQSSGTNSASDINSTSTITEATDKDTKAPTLELVVKPLSQTTNESPAFKIISDEKIKEATCSLDQANLPCAYDGTYTIEATTSNLTDGIHTFNTSVKDLSGNSQTLEYKFTVDTTAPSVSISSTTPSTINNTVSGSDGTKCFTFTVTAGVGAILFSKIDTQEWVKKESGNAFSVCVSVGQHTFQVKAQDSIENESDAVSRTWTLLGKYYTQTVSGNSVIKQRSEAGGSASPYWFTDLFTAETWNDANNGCGSLTHAGYSDWLLPSTEIAREWNSGGVKNFISNANGVFWTSTTSQSVQGTLWKYTNNFSTSTSLGEGQWPTNQTKYVRCIRLGI